MTKYYDRRAILRAGGVALTLPWLPSLCWGGEEAGDTGQGRSPRLVCIYKPHGVCNEEWYPKTFTDRLELTPTLQPLQALKQKVSMISGLSHPTVPEGRGHSGVDCWLTAVDPDSPRQLSLDQLAARGIGRDTRFGSLQLGTKAGAGSAGASFTLSFNDQGIGLPSVNDPLRIFEKLFVQDDAASIAAAEERLRDRRSILDAVLAQSKAVGRDLSVADRRKLAEYQQSVREVEQSLVRSRDWLDRPKPQIPRDQVALDVRIKDNKTEFLRTMYHLAALALITDSTRVITLVTAPEGNNAEGWPEFNVGGHHGLQHHGGKEGALRKLAEVDRAEVELLAGFLQRLQKHQLDEGSLLDHSLVLYGSGMNNGKNDYSNGGGGHGTRKLPTLLAGGGAFGVKHGRHLHYDKDQTPLANLYVSLLTMLGLPEPGFRTATGPLAGLV